MSACLRACELHACHVTAALAHFPASMQPPHIAMAFCFLPQQAHSVSCERGTISAQHWSQSGFRGSSHSACGQFTSHSSRSRQQPLASQPSHASQSLEHESQCLLSPHRSHSTQSCKDSLSDADTWTPSNGNGFCAYVAFDMIGLRRRQRHRQRHRNLGTGDTKSISAALAFLHVPVLIPPGPPVSVAAAWTRHGLRKPPRGTAAPSPSLARKRESFCRSLMEQVKFRKFTKETYPQTKISKCFLL